MLKPHQGLNVLLVCCHGHAGALHPAACLFPLAASCTSGGRTAAKACNDFLLTWPALSGCQAHLLPGKHLTMASAA